MTKTFTCIVCPNGCEIRVESDGSGYRISGEGCPRGKTYVLQEMTDHKVSFEAHVFSESISL